MCAEKEEETNMSQTLNGPSRVGKRFELCWKVFGRESHISKWARWARPGAQEVLGLLGAPVCEIILYCVPMESGMKA